MKLRKKIHYLYNYLENQSILYFFRALFENLNFLGRPNPNFLMNPLKIFTNIYTRKKKILIFFGAGECSSAPAQAEKICLHSNPKVTNSIKIDKKFNLPSTLQKQISQQNNHISTGNMREREKLTLGFYLFNEWER